MQSLVSIIIPAFNSEDTVVRAVKSVLDQSYKNLEVIVIDDGSVDGTATQVLKLANVDNRVKYYKKSNGGVSSARNLGISRSMGQFISFLDSDDFYDKEFIQKCLKLNVDLAFSKSSTLFDDGRRDTSVGDFSKTHPSSKFNFLRNYIGRKLQINTNSWLINKDVITDNGLRFKEGISWAEDFLFFSRVILNCKSYKGVDEVLTYYTVTSKESLSSVKIDRIKSEKLCSQLLISEVEKSTLSKKQQLIIQKMLLEYRVPATVYSTLSQLNRLGKLSNQEFKEMLNSEMGKYSLINGLRSIKLIYRINSSKFKLWRSL